jgi:membrane associated rhomboid family serine protease
MSEFWKKLSKSLGLSYTWWHWRWLNFKKRWAGFFSTDTNVMRHLRSGQKICRRCGALAGADERRCSVCGARLPSAAGSFLYKVFGLIMPGVSPVTAALTTVIVLNFLLQVMSTGGSALLSPGLESLVRAGALDSRLVAAGEWWRLLTCVFVHIGLIHILFNLYALLSVSSFLEAEIGPARYLSLFLLSGLGGSVASFLLHTRVVSAGASGAIFGAREAPGRGTSGPSCSGGPFTRSSSDSLSGLTTSPTPEGSRPDFCWARSWKPGRTRGGAGRHSGRPWPAFSRWP